MICFNVWLCYRYGPIGNVFNNAIVHLVLFGFSLDVLCHLLCYENALKTNPTNVKISFFCRK